MKPVNLYRLIYGHVPISTADTVEPVIPQNRLPTENSLLPRICVSKTLDGCLTAIGPSIIGIRTLLNQFPSKEGTTPSLRNNKEAKLMFPFTILRFDIPANSSYLSPNLLLMHGKRMNVGLLSPVHHPVYPIYGSSMA